MGKLISVIVPIYKVEPYLNQCIESICNQTYHNIEIILVDDGSPDNCGNICDEYLKKDKRIKVIHKENGGLSSARNAGLDIASGDYVSFIDSDDYISDEFFEKLYGLCIQYDCDIAESSFITFKEKPKIKHQEIKIDILSSKEKQMKLYSSDYVRTVIVCNKIYKKYIFDNLRFPIGKINEDEFTTYKALYECRKSIVTTNEALYYYRGYNANSIMGRKFNINRLDALSAWKERKQFYEKNHEELLYQATVKKYQEGLFLYYFLSRDNIDKHKIYTKQIVNEARNNFIEYAKNKNVSKKEILKMLSFCLLPNTYYCLAKMKSWMIWE